MSGRPQREMWFATGVYIRVYKDQVWQAVDIADPQVPPERLDEWLQGQERDALVRLVRLLLEPKPVAPEASLIGFDAGIPGAG